MWSQAKAKQAQSKAQTLGVRGKAVMTRETSSCEVMTTEALLWFTACSIASCPSVAYTVTTGRPNLKRKKPFVYSLSDPERGRKG